MILRTRLWQFRYMTAENEVGKKQSGDKITEFSAQRDQKVTAYAPLVASPEEQKAYDALKAKLDVLRADGERLRSFPPEQHEEAMAFFRGPMNANYLAVSAAANAIVDINIAAGKQAEAATRSEQASAERSILMMLGLAICIAAGAMAFSFLGVSRPIERMTASMRTSRRRDTHADIPYGGRGDEIGAMSETVQVFRQNLIHTRQLEEETALARASAEEQRKRAMREMGRWVRGGGGWRHRYGVVLGHRASGDRWIDEQHGSGDRRAILHGGRSRRGGRFHCQHHCGRSRRAWLIGAGDRPTGRRLGRPCSAGGLPKPIRRAPWS